MKATTALLALLALGSPAFADEEKFGPSGINQQIDFFADVNPDCSSGGIPIVRLIDGPGRGVVTTDKGRDFKPFPQGNVRHVCNRKRVAGTKLFYKSEAGFVGMDRVRVLVLSGTGAGREATYRIQVR